MCLLCACASVCLLAGTEFFAWAAREYRLAGKHIQTRPLKRGRSEGAPKTLMDKARVLEAELCLRSADRFEVVRKAAKKLKLKVEAFTPLNTLADQCMQALKNQKNERRV